MAKSIAHILQDHLKKTLHTHFSEEDTFVLGVSGGADSMALMYLFHLLGRKGMVVHVNYEQRGEDSDQDQELVEQMAFQWGFECCSVHLDPRVAKWKNFQNWARNRRYGFFRDIMIDTEAAAIVTAHHFDDQIETILQKLLRGSGPAAWQGMTEWENDLYRPLLPFTKEQILQFCEEEAVPYREDASNANIDYARNLIRNEMAPQLDSLFPGWQQNILNLQEQGAAFEAGMQVLAEQVTGDSVLKLVDFKDLPEATQPAVLKHILDSLGYEGQYTKGQLKELAEDIQSMQTGRTLRLENLYLTRDRDLIRFHDGEDSKEIHQTITLKDAEKGISLDHVELKLQDKLKNQAALNLDASALEWPLTLRNWESGDIIVPLGMEGHQKVSDHLTNRKIPTLLKGKTLVLCGSDSTIYAIIYPAQADNGESGAIADSVKYNSSSHSYFTIKIL